MYQAKKLPFTVISEMEVGLVESIDGNAVPPGKIFARVVEDHNSFQDGEAFLANGGEKGPQIEILPPGNYRINPVLFQVRKVAVTVVERGKIALVTAMDGGPIPSGRLLAQQVAGHSNLPHQHRPLQRGDLRRHRHSAEQHRPGHRAGR